MPVFIKFENDRQVETTTSQKNPGKGWHLAPKTFDWTHQYKLNAKGSIEKMSEEALLAKAREQALAQKKEEIGNYANLFRAHVFPSGEPKGEEYRVKSWAARAIIDADAYDENCIEARILQPEAEARGIEVKSHAQSIFDKAAPTWLNIGQIAAFEWKAKALLSSGEELQTLFIQIEQLVNQTAAHLNMEL